MGQESESVKASLSPNALVDAALEDPYASGDNLGGDDIRRIDYLPTPLEIAEACASIRSGWTLSEKRRRFVGEWMPDEVELGWRPPVIDTSHFRLSLARGAEGAR